MKNSKERLIISLESLNIWPKTSFSLSFSEILRDFSTRAIKRLGKHKAPGPDGFAAEFLLKSIFLTLFEEFYKNGRLNACVLENFLCLIQRKENAVLIKDFRPISQTTLTYKVIAKVLPERPKKVMPSNVHHCSDSNLIFLLTRNKLFIKIII